MFEISCIQNNGRLLYFQMCNMQKILPNKNRLKHCIFYGRLGPLVFPYSDEYLIS